MLWVTSKFWVWLFCYDEMFLKTTLSHFLWFFSITHSCLNSFRFSFLILILKNADACCLKIVDRLLQNTMLLHYPASLKNKTNSTTTSYSTHFHNISTTNMCVGIKNQSRHNSVGQVKSYRERTLAMTSVAALLPLFISTHLKTKNKFTWRMIFELVD